MKSLLLCVGLPGPGYHGGAVTCWAIVRAMLARGHEVTVASLYDRSPNNPYLEARAEQIRALEEIGAGVRMVEYDGTSPPIGLEKREGGYRALCRKMAAIFNPRVKDFFTWAALRSQVRRVLEGERPDAIFCYHFDALSAVVGSTTFPVMAGVGDLWHLPQYFRWKGSPPTLKKYTRDAALQFATRRASRILMIRMLRVCNKKGAFAAHYAEWLRKQRGLGDTLYLRTPVHDPVGDRWLNRRRSHKEKKRLKILMIGDLATTSTGSGLKEFFGRCFPELKKRLGPGGFEVHLVGGGEPPPELRDVFQEDEVKLRGRVTPPDDEFISSDFLLVPTSITLGIRVRIISAFSFGCPVIAHRANAAGIPELRHGENVLLYGKAGEATEQMMRFCRQTGVRERLEENGRKTFEAYFSEKAAAGRIVDEMEVMAG